ncbi:MAG: D-alanyl-D-alanine carboxypeptidase/D-alanyl-D-alanine-endopeptidase [Planctomycetota bacterium]|nr:D-alanyl-D-alanine carboxypeptidase/D-alanyl-D-alanine-endopeptidase [Planctomycetota bacterium]
MYRAWLTLLLVGIAGAQDRAAVATAAAHLLDAEALAGARVGIVVYDLDSEESLYTHDADRGFMTASNMKLISSAVALQQLGPDFRFTTRLVAKSDNNPSVLGNLWLVGDGDPSLGGRPIEDSMAPLRAMARKLHEAGVRRIDGDVFGDASCQPVEPYGRGWQWDYLETYYAVPMSGLCFGENLANVFVSGSGQVGTPPELRIEPVEDAVSVVHDLRCLAKGSKTALSFGRAPHGKEVQLRGAIAADAAEQRLRVAVTDPPQFAAQAMVAALREQGIEVAGQARTGRAPAGAVTVAEHVSAPLAEIVDPLLRDSVNVYAEQVWWRAARTAGAVDSAAVERHGKQVLRELGVPTDGMLLADGSGLSRRNLVQPRQIAALLEAIWRGPLLASVWPALPVAGVDGTLRRRFPPSSPCHGRLRAKTGFISYVVCLSGYLPRPEPAPPLVFVVMINNFTCPTKAAQDAIDAFCNALAGAVGWAEPPQPGREVVPATGTGRRDRE